MLLSRVADALYWISRYLERAEHTSRLSAVAVDLGLDRAAAGDHSAIERLYASLEAPSAGSGPSLTRCSTYRTATPWPRA